MNVSGYGVAPISLARCVRSRVRGIKYEYSGVLCIIDRDGARAAVTRARGRRRVRMAGHALCYCFCTLLLLL